MKGVIGFLFFLLFVAGLFLVFLQGKSMTGAGLSAGGAELTAVRWQATYVGAESVPEDAEIWVQFEVDGSIRGNAGCNSFSGSLEQTDAGVKVGPLGATRSEGGFMLDFPAWPATPAAPDAARCVAAALGSDPGTVLGGPYTTCTGAVAWTENDNGATRVEPMRLAVQDAVCFCLLQLLFCPSRSQTITFQKHSCPDTNGLPE